MQLMYRNSKLTMCRFVEKTTFLFKSYKLSDASTSTERLEKALKERGIIQRMKKLSSSISHQEHICQVVDEVVCGLSRNGVCVTNISLRNVHDTVVTAAQYSINKHGLKR